METCKPRRHALQKANKLDGRTVAGRRRDSTISCNSEEAVRILCRSHGQAKQC